VILYNKAVRDKIPEIIKADGKECRFKILSNEEFLVELEKKLGEEIEEYRRSWEIMELVDVMEILYRVAELKGVSANRFELLRERKRAERGGFSENLFRARCYLITGLL